MLIKRIENIEKKVLKLIEVNHKLKEENQFLKAKIDTLSMKPKNQTSLFDDLQPQEDLSENNSIEQLIDQLVEKIDGCIEQIQSIES